MGMKVKAIRGVLWSLVEYGGGEVISFVVFLILARLVAPSDFGVVALAGVFIAFVQLFLVQGFADAVIQRQNLEPDHVYTAFWSNLGIAAAFLVLTVLGADLVAAIFRQPLLADVLRWLSLVFVSTALISTHQAVLKRELRFAAFALRALAGITVGGVVGITMAFLGYGVWSLVGQQLANGVVSIVVIWSTSEWRPKFRFSRRCFREMVVFSANVIGSNLVGFLYKKLDVFLIGFLLDARQLGYYYLVQRLLITMGLVTLSTVQAIVMPVLSRLQHDRAQFNEAFTTTIQLTQSIWLPMVLGLGLVSSPLIPLLFGEAWRPTIPLLQIMCLTGFTQVFSFFSGQALYAAGQPALHLRLSLLQVCLTAAIFLPAATMFGVVGVAAAYTLVSAAVIPFHLRVLQRNVGLNPAELFRRCRAPVLAALAMAAAVIVLELELGPMLPPIARVAVVVAAGAATYVGALALLAPRLVRQVIGIAESALGRSPAPVS